MTRLVIEERNLLSLNLGETRLRMLGYVFNLQLVAE